MGQDEYYLLVHVWIKIEMENFQLQNVPQQDNITKYVGNNCWFGNCW